MIVPGRLDKAVSDSPDHFPLGKLIDVNLGRVPDGTVPGR